MKVLDPPRVDTGPPEPDPESVRRRRRPGLVAVTVTLTILAGIYVAVESPARLWFEQRAEIKDGQAEIDRLEAEIAELEAQRQALRDDDAVELMAREEFLLARPGEEVFVIRPPATLTVDMPATWPFAGFAHLFEGQ
jgi:cell division protein FtsB